MKKKDLKDTPKKDNMIQETFYLDMASLVDYKDEATGTEYTKFKGIGQQIDTKNDNARIYTEEGIDDMIENIMPKVRKGGVVCLLDHPDYFERSKIKNEAALITDVYKDGKNVIIEGKFIKNKNWHDYLKPRIDAGATLMFSVNGYTANPDVNPSYDTEKQAMMFGKGYRVSSWDFVINPANNEAGVTHLEQKEEETNINNKNKEESIMENFKTLDELKANYPTFFVTIDNQVKQLTDEKAVAVASVDTLTKENATIKAEQAKTVASLDAVSKELAGLKLQNGIAEIMKDHKYAKFITVPKTVDSVEEAKAYVEAETKKLDEFAATVKPTVETIVPAKPDVPAVGSQDSKEVVKPVVKTAEQNEWDKTIADAIAMARN